ncbi:hypothetical protein [Actinotalea sp. Marseille-Q4924]|uniref:hypothetical protein n=1 Tax=Actinotalea sp. Marseille-Q4924 TaxID=2866571 RepID=UPI001CE44B52|nr:hypothetical protein [Actinotalea sp. Marseille-Q4924]
MTSIHQDPVVGGAPAPLVPHSLRIDGVGAMLNAELADDPVYDGVELQSFDDDTHGTGMLVFLSRRADRSVDYYVQRGLRLDAAGYRIGGGTRSWTETEFDVARLQVAADGVLAEVRFTDVDGRAVEVHVDDRDGRPRRRARLLAPVSAGIVQPGSLLMVWMGGFDLVRVAGRAPVIRIGGRTASIGRLPGALLHRRHLVKYATALCSVELDRDGDAPAGAGGTGEVEVTADGSAVRRVTAARDGHAARVTFDPPFPDLRTLPDGNRSGGRWTIEIDGSRVTWRRMVGRAPRRRGGRQPGPPGALETPRPAAAHAGRHDGRARLPTVADDVRVARGGGSCARRLPRRMASYRRRRRRRIPPRDGQLTGRDRRSPR